MKAEDAKQLAKAKARIALATLPPELKGSHSEFGLKAMLSDENPVDVLIAIGEDGYKRNVKAFEPGGRLHPDTISPCCGRPNRECGAWQTHMAATQAIVETLDQLARTTSRVRRALDAEELNPAIIARAEAGGEHESIEDFFKRINVDFGFLGQFFENLTKQ